MSGDYTPEQLLADLTRCREDNEQLSTKYLELKKETDRLTGAAKAWAEKYNQLSEKYQELDTRFEQILDKVMDKI
jgi:predicted nuclease with TOPRIM domain